MDREIQELCERASAICLKHECSLGSGSSPDFPADLWRDLGHQNLMGIIIPKKYKGLGLELTTLGKVTEQLVISGAHNHFGPISLILSPTGGIIQCRLG